MPTSLSNITVKDSAHSLVIKSNDITIDGTSILGQNNFANKDLSNLSTTGQNILDSKLDTTQISNCITYIPQDIKLELSNSALTLKAGSKVYVPNGFESDGTTRKFDVITIENDMVTSSGNNDIQLHFYASVGNFWGRSGAAGCYSGDTEPTSASNYSFWYDTANNLMKRKINDNWQSSDKYALPSLIATTSSTGYTSIDQVFNGFGYIGSTVFALPGVKGLIPNGRNTDGSLKNTEFTNTSVAIGKLGQTGTYQNINIVLTSYNTMNADSVYDYDPETNYNFNKTSGNNYTERVIIGKLSISESKITSLTPKTPFHAVDYNDFSDLKDTVDNDVVKLTGNQTVAGTKTFTSSLIISNNIADTSLYFKDTGIASNSTVPSANRMRSFRVMANDNTILGDVRFARQSSGNMTSQLTCRATINSTVYNSSVTANISSTGVAYGTCSTPPATSNTTDNYIATTGWCNDPTKSTNVVHRSGNETIGGTKTLNTTYTSFKGTSIDITNAKTTLNDVGINWLDKNGTVLGQNHIRTNTDGSIQNNMYIKAHNSNNWASVSVGFDANDNVYTLAPTPAVSSNSTNIATTAYVNNKFQVVSALPASPDSNVFYFIPA